MFAQLLGTLILLEEDEKARVKGLIINKFRGDKTILDPGVEMLEERGGVKVAGVVPYMHLSIEDEDSLSGQLDNHDVGVIDLAVIRFPRISNFTDFNVFERLEGVSVRYVSSVQELGQPDMIFCRAAKIRWVICAGCGRTVWKPRSKSWRCISRSGDLRWLSDAGAYHFGPTWGRE